MGCSTAARLHTRPCTASITAACVSYTQHPNIHTSAQEHKNWTTYQPSSPTTHVRSRKACTCFNMSGWADHSCAWLKRPRAPAYFCCAPRDPHPLRPLRPMLPNSLSNQWQYPPGANHPGCQSVSLPLWRVLCSDASFLASLRQHLDHQILSGSSSWKSQGHSAVRASQRAGEYTIGNARPVVITRALASSATPLAWHACICHRRGRIRSALAWPCAARRKAHAGQGIMCLPRAARSRQRRATPMLWRPLSFLSLAAFFSKAQAAEGTLMTLLHFVFCF